MKAFLFGILWRLLTLVGILAAVVYATSSPIAAQTINPCDEVLRLAPPWFTAVLTLILLAYNTWLSYKGRQAAQSTSDELREWNGARPDR